MNLDKMQKKAEELQRRFETEPGLFLIACPHCHHSGDLRDTANSGFELRGKWRSYPVVKCGRCGLGMYLKIGRRKATPVLFDPEQWGFMEGQRWAMEHG